MSPEQVIHFSGVVGQGKQRGRQLGFPTANLQMDPQATEDLPRGVFAGRLRWQGEDWRWAVINIGHRPTFDAGVLSIEAHVLDYAGDLYGRLLEVELLWHLRGERRFAGVEDLIAQIALDVENTRNYIKRKTINNTTEV